MQRLVYPDGVQEIIRRLSEHGYTAVLVGGSVRDLLRGVTPHDYDIATSASPSEMKAVFPDVRLLETGIRHGTLSFLMPDGCYEVTTFRVDLGYKDNRHPEEVRFTPSFREDAARRDFTVNAMGYSEETGVLDYFGGREDLENRVLRAVGVPRLRMTEDALRILRALRFAAVLGFSIEAETRAALFETKELLLHVSAERIREELSRLLVGAYAVSVLREYRDIIAVVLPCLRPMFDFAQKSPHHIYDVYQHTLKALENTPPVLPLRLAVLFHDVGKPACFFTDENGNGHFYGHEEKSKEIASKALHFLRYDNKTTEHVEALVAMHGARIPEGEKSVRRLLAKMGEPLFFDYLKVAYADNSALSPIHFDRLPKLLEAEKMAAKILKDGACLSLKTLAITGDDILALGVPPGKRVGALLHTALSAVLDGRLPNEKDALLTWVRTNIKKQRQVKA